MAVSREIRDSFCSTHVIDWDQPFVFVSLEKKVSHMVIEISVDIKGNVTEAHPCNLYYMDREECLALQIS